MADLFAAYVARMEASGERVVVTIIAYAVITLLLLVALGASIYAAATAVALAYGPVAAALSVAVFALVAALAVLGWLGYRRRSLRRRRLLRKATQPALTAAAMQALPVALRASPLGTLAAVAAAAYVLAKASQK
ncbi:hypothetical protein JJB09_01275 [Rhizobium sp. KVB221]|uniref:Holin-X, holin superfamily III n=1 Tax=Rhizobium setariae TaxID=2801340 RepID=A0A936YQD6_9HYPH|nr:hypothetical protein [Rhizobium setariae]MBL0370647.1 hypothetical protein [Rhizobium setariae]